MRLHGGDDPAKTHRLDQDRPLCPDRARRDVLRVRLCARARCGGFPEHSGPIVRGLPSRRSRTCGTSACAPPASA